MCVINGTALVAGALIKTEMLASFRGSFHAMPAATALVSSCTSE
jgi:hypothetical protein